MISGEELDRLQALADGATQGPWRAETWDTTPQGRSYPGGPRVLFPGSEPDDNVGGALLMNGNVRFADDDANCAFVAACREAVPALIAEVRELRTLVQDMLADGYQKSRASKHKQALEEILRETRVADLHSGNKVIHCERIAREALREDEDDDV